MEIGNISSLKTAQTQTSVSIEMQKKAMDAAKSVLQILETLPRINPDRNVGAKIDLVA